MKARSYCIVPDCLNNNKLDTSLSFFTLPKNPERRRVWLTLIDREDLLQKKDIKRTSYLVCCVHFEQSAIKLIRHLKEDAVPTLCLPPRLVEAQCCKELIAISPTLPIKVEQEDPSYADTSTCAHWALIPNKVKKEEASSELDASSTTTESNVPIIVNIKTEKPNTRLTSLLTEKEPIKTSKSDETRKRKISDELEEVKLENQKLDEENKKIKKELQELRAMIKKSKSKVPKTK